MRRNLVDLATSIALTLFHPRDKEPFAERLVLMTKDGRDLGGWGLGPARDRIYAELLKRPRRRPRRHRRRTRG